MYRQQNATQERFCTNTLRKNRVIRPVSLIQNEIKGARPNAEAFSLEAVEVEASCHDVTDG